MSLSMSEFVFYGVMMTVFAVVVVVLRQMAPDLHHIAQLLIAACVGGPCGYMAQQAYDRANAAGPGHGGFDDQDVSRKDQW